MVAGALAVLNLLWRFRTSIVRGLVYISVCVAVSVALDGVFNIIYPDPTINLIFLTIFVIIILFISYTT